MDRWGITPEQFEEALARHASDEGMLAWAQSRISDAHADAANSWLCIERFENLNRQDKEENAYD
jgi:hypothetical protein